MPYTDKEKKRANGAKYSRESRAFWKSMHRCIDCTKQDAYTLGGRARCEQCSEKRREYNREYHRAHSELIQERGRRAYAERKAAGLCAKCGRELEDTTFTHCARCRARDAERHRKDDLRGVGGLCACCGREKAENGKLCPACYERAMMNLEKAHKMQSTENHPWRRDEQLRIMSITGRAAV